MNIKKISSGEHELCITNRELKGEARMEEYQYEMSIQILHPSLDPAVVTQELKISPSYSGMAHQASRTVHGGLREGHNKQSFWIAHVVKAGAWPDDLIESTIHEKLESLRPHKALFHAIRAEGGSVALSFSWFLSGSAGLSLSSELIAIASELAVELDFGIYRAPRGAVGDAPPAA